MASDAARASSSGSGVGSSGSGSGGSSSTAAARASSGAGSGAAAGGDDGFPLPRGPRYDVASLVSAAPALVAERGLLGEGGALGRAESVRRSPCFRPAALSATLVAACLAGHRWRAAAALAPAARDALLGFTGVFAAQWYLCRQDEAQRREELRAFYAGEAARAARGAAAAAAAGAPPLPRSGGEGGAGGAGGAGGPARGWRDDLEALTKYELTAVQHGGKEESVVLR